VVEVLPSTTGFHISREIKTMLISAEILLRHQVEGKDGILGIAKDIFFDSQTWTVRYLVIDPNEGSRHGQLLVPANLFTHPDWGNGCQVLPASLTKDQADNIPDIRAALPMSRRDEVRILDYFGSGHFSRPLNDKTSKLDPAVNKDDPIQASDWDPYLKSFKATDTFDVFATDGKVGKLEDFIVDTDSWTLSSMVVDTDKCILPPRKMAVSPAWIVKLDGLTKRVHLDQSKNGVANFPDFDPTAPVNRENDTTLYDYYGRLNQMI